MQNCTLLKLFIYFLDWFVIFFNCEYSPAIQENRVTTVQGLSGTGSLRIGAEFLARHYHEVSDFLSLYFVSHIFQIWSWRHFDKIVYNFSCQRTIYIPQPTWGNHPKVFTLAGLSVKTYRYYDPNTRGLDFSGLGLSFSVRLFNFPFLLLNLFLFPWCM